MAEAGDGLRRPAGVAFAAGGVALLAAMAADFIAVLGRHLGLPLLGSIEIVQMLVVIAASAALVGATLSGAHAAVHVITERLRPGAQLAWARVGSALGTVFFAGLTAGNAWLAAETFGGDERTDLLGLPLFPLRLIWTAATLLAALLFAAQVLRPKLPAQETPREP